MKPLLHIYRLVASLPISTSLFILTGIAVSTLYLAVLALELLETVSCR